MPKEYEDIKANVRKQYPKESDDSVSARAAKIFYSIFHITVKEAMDLESKGEWKSYLKKIGKSGESDKKDAFDNPFGIYVGNPSFGLEYKSQDDGDFYVMGFPSAPYFDAKGDYIDQETLLRKYNDPYNNYAKKLSYCHRWMKKDVLDFEKPLGVLQSAELKEHPIYHVPAVYGTWKLIKTHPYYNQAVYELQNGALDGLSVELKDSQRVPMTLGDVSVNYLVDYELKGTGVVNRQMNDGALITNFIYKDLSYIGKDDDSDYDNKELEHGSHSSPQKGYPKDRSDYAIPDEYKYPIDTEEHVRAAISYFSKPKNARMYSREKQLVIWGRIKSAAKKYGIELSVNSGPPAVSKKGVDKTMEKKDNEEVSKNQDVVNPNPNGSDVLKPANDSTSANKTENMTVNVVDSVDDELSALRKELDDLKKTMSVENKKKEIELVKKEIDKLKAPNRVLVDNSEQNFTNQAPPQLSSSVGEQVKSIQSDKKLSTYEKLRRIAELDGSI